MAAKARMRRAVAASQKQPNNMAGGAVDLNSITVQDFKDYFTRDFPYLPAGVQTNPDPNLVSDNDIEKAFAEAQMMFNQGLFGTDAQVEIGYLYLTAHYLTLDLRAGLSGISGGAQYPVASKSVGSVSESYSIPQEYLDDPYLATYTQTTYGLKYLSFVLPAIRGNVQAVWGGTNP